MICTYCNEEIPDNALTCPKCGAPMDSVTQQLADLQRLQTRALETAPEEVQPDKPIQPVRPIRPSQHTQVVAARSHKILITIAAVLFLCIVIVLLLSLF